MGPSVGLSPFKCCTFLSLLLVFCLGHTSRIADARAMRQPATSTDCITDYNGPAISRVPFWKRQVGPWPTTSKWNQSSIPHTDLPFSTANGYTVDAGQIGMNEFSRPDVLRAIDKDAEPWAKGTVDEVWGLPNSTTGGYILRTTNFHDNFYNGFKSENFVILSQKASISDNVDIVTDIVDGVKQNVLRLRINAIGNGPSWHVTDGACVQTTDFFAAGRYEVQAKVPAALGMVWALWTFHYEPHYDPAHLPAGEADSQFVPDVTGYISRLNHEIDWEMPASCSGLCDNGGCPGQFDTANLNSYLYANNNGLGPGFLNMCVRAPEGKSFIAGDNAYHSYAFEWHTGDTDDPEKGCTPHVDFFIDGEYVSTTDVFIPSRGSRFVFGVWPGNANWVGRGDWKQEEVLVSKVSICPFNEKNDAMYPQRFDQPGTKNRLWTTKEVEPVLPSQMPPKDECPGIGPGPDVCALASDRPNGCNCTGSDGGRGGSIVCKSNCCDARTQLCADADICAAMCSASSNRSDGCLCSQRQQCQSGCCGIDNTCVDAAFCKSPCSAGINRPNGCNCSLAGECYSECCDYHTLPGVGNGTCASASICSEECASSTKPIGCHCETLTDCETGCCADNICKMKDSCPTPGECDGKENRAVGCGCTHSWQCMSQWCVRGKCSDH